MLKPFLSTESSPVLALPFILFPPPSPTPFVVLLLPGQQEDQEGGRTESIAGSVSMSLRYSLYMGFPLHWNLCTVRPSLGISVFKGRTGRTLYADPCLALSISLPGCHHGHL